MTERPEGRRPIGQECSRHAATQRQRPRRPVVVTTAVGAGPGAASGIGAAAARPGEDVLRELEVTPAGLTEQEAARRLERWGPNAVRSHRARGLLVLWHQVRSPLLGLLLAARRRVVLHGRAQRRRDHRGDRGALGGPRLRQRVPGGEDRRCWCCAAAGRARSTSLDWVMWWSCGSAMRCPRICAGRVCRWC
ncbi:cation-transporting P-type ATPase [Streptomyces griseofuscus]|uniref:cation-transporting P-type ATPase n=1 Tax=Streptomyces griseofuscus TaxID=146922 RepID=UPI0034037885